MAKIEKEKRITGEIKMTAKSLIDYSKEITDDKCICGNKLDIHDIDFYDHDAGWKVKGFEKKQWLYITCKKCKYQMALWKMGVAR